MMGVRKVKPRSTPGLGWEIEKILGRNTYDSVGALGSRGKACETTGKKWGLINHLGGGGGGADSGDSMNH